MMMMIIITNIIINTPELNKGFAIFSEILVIRCFISFYLRKLTRIRTFQCWSHVILTANLTFCEHILCQILILLELRILWPSNLQSFMELEWAFPLKSVHFFTKTCSHKFLVNCTYVAFNRVLESQTKNDPERQGLFALLLTFTHTKNIFIHNRLIVKMEN